MNSFSSIELIVVSIEALEPASSVCCAVSRKVLPIVSPLICGWNSSAPKVVWARESRAAGPSVIVGPYYTTCPSELSLECVDVGVFELGSLTNGGV